MQNTFRCLILGLFAIVLSSCAYTVSIPVDYNDTNTNGIRVYEPKPILIVSNQTAQVSWIPNFNKGYAIQYRAFLAKNDLELATANGVLTTLNGKIDSTGFLTFFEGITKEAIKKGTSVFAPFGGGEESGKYRLAIFEFEFDNSGNFIGLKPMTIDSSAFVKIDN